MKACRSRCEGLRAQQIVEQIVDTHYLNYKLEDFSFRQILPIVTWGQ